jgi:hypothetical protein
VLPAAEGPVRGDRWTAVAALVIFLVCLADRKPAIRRTENLSNNAALSPPAFFRRTLGVEISPTTGIPKEEPLPELSAAAVLAKRNKSAGRGNARRFFGR